MFTRMGGERTGDPWPGWLWGVMDSDNSRRPRLQYSIMAGLIGAGCKVVRALSRRWGLLGRDRERRRGKGKRNRLWMMAQDPFPRRCLN
jgi:hypothetical protein